MRATDPETSADSLRLRVAELEGEVQELHRQLSEQAARTNAAVAAAQDRAYWLDRWHLDLNALMRRPGAAALRGLLRSVRGATRRAGRVLGAARGRG